MEDLLTVEQVVYWIKKELSPLLNKEELSYYPLLIFHHLRGYERKDLFMHASLPTTKEEVRFIAKILTRLKQEEPIQYILGMTEFYGLIFKTDDRALIPRPETEELVEWILKSNENKEIEILDVGTGTGCIAISLKKHLPYARVSAWDISQKALELAKENALAHNVDIHFVKQDVLKQKVCLPNSLDLLVSNPPYVTMKEKELMSSNVINFEPHNALFVEDNEPLLFYEAIARLGSEMLRANGWIYFEINEAYGEETKNLLRNLNYSSIEIKKDLFGRDRMVRAIHKSS